ncbi:hypothetical protein [Hymenobacter sp. GOD-10R]|uniref:hypothetical protein n=1 Tax=Hymenobacter sp. GOD-10R TaxID=3093922 RepID=UPI002D78968F|nr:hypothetical protein [Hymenobacter sp. GOD-10R]WRQ27302.1 hypothetical protein SD425_19710 [Hymenobacter sp. GOD-10R]
MSIPPNHLETVHDIHGQLLLEFWHYQSEQVLYARWFGNITAEAVIQGAQQATALQSWLHCPFVLNDKHEATGDWSEAMTWLEYEWLPQAVKDGLRAVAYVFATDVSNQIVSIEFMKRVQPHIAIEMFYDASMAWDWLMRQPLPRASA